MEVALLLLQILVTMRKRGLLPSELVAAKAPSAPLSPRPHPPLPPLADQGEDEINVVELIETRIGLFLIV